jgi:hypothetical protein
MMQNGRSMKMNIAVGYRGWVNSNSRFRSLFLFLVSGRSLYFLVCCVYSEHFTATLPAFPEFIAHAHAIRDKFPSLG